MFHSARVLEPSFPRRERALIPAGMVTILPRTARRVRSMEQTLMDTLGRWGYEEIIPPTFEYLDVLSAGLEPDVIEKCYTMSDRATGRVLLLRPDVTAQIARIVGMGMLGPQLPLRLSYRTTVFRYEPDHAGREREIFQVGAELIGVDDVATDGEIIGLMVDCLRDLGLTEFKISLGHVGFFRALLAQSGLSPDGQKRAEHAAARKDLPRLEEILAAERVEKSRIRIIMEAPQLYGQEEVLKRGRVLAGRDRVLRGAVDRLARIYALLEASGLKSNLLLDLGEFRGFEYYDGVVFEVFASGWGYELGGGGRYNHLIGRFGRDLPSTGFAFDVDRLFRALEGRTEKTVGVQVDVLVCATASRSAQAFHVARTLRQHGLRVVQRIAQDGDDTSTKHLDAAGRLIGAPAIVSLNGRGKSFTDAVVTFSADGVPARTIPKSATRKRVTRRVTLDELPQILKPSRA
jgi:ATP phosphoribosyltransferase regulatory subunit